MLADEREFALSRPVLRKSVEFIDSQPSTKKPALHVFIFSSSKINFFGKFAALDLFKIQEISSIFGKIINYSPERIQPGLKRNSYFNKSPH